MRGEFDLLLPIVVMASSMTDPSAQPTLDAFEAVLRRHDSATLALEEWCAARGVADPARITAHSAGEPGAEPPGGVRRQLGLEPDEPLAMRNVRLACGQTVLSVAWNWYVPSRLTVGMNEMLRDSDVPFGKVVAPLRFRRQQLEVVRGQAENCPEGTISTHRAMLLLPDGRPLAYLIECYTAANLAGSR
ncbi:hypothetical protein [Novosphingobium mangrovi (ex Huang et al. 2023)]|uniref:Chorismate lyase n=1 Tax=Novosphingobium mangrovi (ex Huang et al. 2023) TaxID=2976432 RepID=A0ABT2I4P7_9SPHN|nr:hypothetical protein [Novosphingobium mangrovi (ex Huang et al. 2023)]MCT2399760.1 hypothetical protein [Novosphingobium mangrovi (ex Huang et al. 2023)]